MKAVTLCLNLFFCCSQLTASGFVIPPTPDEGRRIVALVSSSPRITITTPSLSSATAVFSTPSESSASPTTFREAEVLGLRLMQEGKHEDALKTFKNAMNLPGSRPDIIRTKTLSGPSPVGGSAGGTEGKQVMTLDEFEMQACHYNIACAFARLGNVKESVANLKSSFDYGFDNYATVRADPDLSAVQETIDFDNLMGQYDPKWNKGGGGGGFTNPFSSLFGGK